MEADLTKTRRPRLAGLLSLTGVPIGQLYAGHLWRAIILAGICSVALPISTFIIVSLPLSQLIMCSLIVFVLSTPLILAIDAFFLTRRNRRSQLEPYQRWWVYLLVYIAATFFGAILSYGIRIYVAEAFIMPTRSMLPTIQYHDRFLVDKFFFDSSQLKRNDLAVHWTSAPEPRLVVKRVIGLPGEVVEIKNEQLFINGQQAEDEHAALLDSQQLIPELTNCGPVTVPAGEYFVLGDNRRNSLDSRMNGTVPSANFIGIARLIYWSNDYHFPSDHRRQPICGAIRWDRIGQRLD